VGQPNTSHESRPVRGSGPPDLRSRAPIHSQRPTESGGPSAHSRHAPQPQPARPRRHGLRRRRLLLLLLNRTLLLPLNSIPSKDASPAAAPRQATAAAGPLGTPPGQTRPPHPCIRLTAADHPARIVSAGAEVPPEMRLGEAAGRRRWVVGSEGGWASGAGRVEASRAIRGVVVRVRARYGGGGATSPGVAAGACRHAVRRPAAGGRAGGSRGHQYRFCFSYDNYLRSLIICKLIYYFYVQLPAD